VEDYLVPEEDATDKTPLEGRALENRRLLYEETQGGVDLLRVAPQSLTLFFSALGALLALSSWLLQNEPLVAGAPLALAAGFSYVLLRLEERNAAILQKCYDVASALELELRPDGSIFHEIKRIKGHTYTRLSQWSSRMRAAFSSSSLAL